jgi:hypothetical protein
VTVIFFALFGSLFVLTQYLQLVHGYSPLSAGVRALPFALAMGVVSPLSPVLAQRLGTRLVIPAGMTLMGLGLIDLSAAHVHSSYPPLAAAVAIMGAGMGLVMAPASNTIMATVPSHQAGAGSAINDTIREVGGALGIAVIGSIAAGAYSSRLTPELAAAHVPGQLAHIATGSIAAADLAGSRAGGLAGAELTSAAHTAFVHAMSVGLRVAAVVALVSAVAAIFALPRRGALAAAPGSAGQPEADGQAGPAAAGRRTGPPETASVSPTRRTAGLAATAGTRDGPDLRSGSSCARAAGGPGDSFLTADGTARSRELWPVT